MNKNLEFVLFLIILSQITLGCSKDFLDEKPSSSILMPVQLEEFEQLLDNTSRTSVSSGLGILSADEYAYSSDVIWQSTRTATARNSYIWASDIYEGETTEYWNLPYTTIFYANSVLEGLDKIEVNRHYQDQKNNIKGWALFVRAYAMYDLLKDFSPLYDERTSRSDLGIPLRLKASVDEVLPRSSVDECHKRIIQDLTEAGILLRDNISQFRNRPSKAAVHALFARIYLNISDYKKAELHADSSLAYYSTLINYNTLNKTAQIPFAYNHAEQLYAKAAVSQAEYAAVSPNSYIKVAENLINLYHPDDLRLTIFFTRQVDGTYDMKGGYYGALYPYTGLATDEVFLIKAECAALRNDKAEAINYLNKLLINRYLTGMFSPIKEPNTTAETVKLIRTERQKELIWRGSRWDDLKRYNKEGANIILTRIVNGNTYRLLANDPKYVFPIPDNEIGLSGIVQNKR